MSRILLFTPRAGNLQSGRVDAAELVTEEDTGKRWRARLSGEVLTVEYWGKSADGTPSAWRVPGDARLVRLFEELVSAGRALGRLGHPPRRWPAEIVPEWRCMGAWRGRVEEEQLVIEQLKGGAWTEPQDIHLRLCCDLLFRAAIELGAADRK